MNWTLSILLLLTFPLQLYFECNSIRIIATRVFRGLVDADAYDLPHSSLARETCLSMGVDMIIIYTHPYRFVNGVSFSFERPSRFKYFRHIALISKMIKGL